jgi:hypothetical protein
MATKTDEIESERKRPRSQPRAKSTAKATAPAQEKPDRKAQASAVMAKHVGRSIGGSRLRTTTDAIGVTTFGRFLTIEPPPTSENDWQVADLDSQTLHRETPERLTELLVDLSPDVNRANWDWMRALNPGWECDVFVPGSTETRHERGYQLVEDVFDTLNRL